MDGSFLISVALGWAGLAVLTNTYVFTVLAIYTTVWLLHEYGYLDENWGDVFVDNYLRILNGLHYYNVVTELMYVGFMQLRFILTKVDHEETTFQVLFLLTAYPSLYLLML